MKILIVDLVHPILIEKLSKNGHFVDYYPKIEASKIEAILNLYNGLVIRSKIKLTKEILSKNRQLKFIARVGAGLESIDVAYAESVGIKCINSPEGNRNSVGEQAVGMILNLFNNICFANNQVNKGVWKREENRGLELEGKTIGIIGYGNMGSSFAKCLQGFDVKIISYDKYKTNYSDGNTEEVDLNEIYEKTDILSIHTPLTNETKYMFNNEFIDNFHKNFYLINTARGKIVKTLDLVAKMKTGKILGAVLDVLEYENISFEKLNNNEQITNSDFEFSRNLKYLKKAKNVILTPHIAGLTRESNIKLSEVIADKILQNNIFNKLL